MEKYVLGVDLGTSAVKVSCLNQCGKIIVQKSEAYPISITEEGYREQNPEDWVQATFKAITKIVQDTCKIGIIEGLSFSGQMHSLVLLDDEHKVIRPAILWNDTRTGAEADYINQAFEEKIVKITGNKGVAGFTLPKLLWLKKHERNNLAKADVILMPKDYVRYRITGKIDMDLSDATGTLMLDIAKGTWSSEILNFFQIPAKICPHLVSSTDFIGNPLKEVCELTGLSPTVKVFAGAGDNAAAAIGAGILNSKTILCSIGTSGVILAEENAPHMPYEGTLQMENHVIRNHFYSMGVTLSAGDSLNWFQKALYPDLSYDQIISCAEKSTIGANNLLFAPYLSGERTPYSDPYVRGCFIGVSQTTSKEDFCRAVIEGITFSLRQVVEIYMDNNKRIDQIISIGGGAKSLFWQQMQANIFHKPIISLKNEQGPGIGAAMIAAMGCGWFKSWKACFRVFVSYGQTIYPSEQAEKIYDKFYQIYRKIYAAIAPLTKKALKGDN